MYCTVLSTTYSLASPWLVIAMNAGTSCHCWANILNRHWCTEAWHKAYAHRPSSNPVVFPWNSQGIGELVISSTLWWMWSTCLFHQSQSHLRNARTLCISSSRSSTSLVYHITHAWERHYSIHRAVVYSAPENRQYEQVHTFVTCLICAIPHHTHVHGPNPWWASPPLWISYQCFQEPTDIFSLEDVQGVIPVRDH